MNKSILCWVGGKQKLASIIINEITKRNNGKSIEQFVEGFVGGASMSFNIKANEYVWCDYNQDLMNLYIQLKKEKQYFIQEAQSLFVPKTVNKEAYLNLRDEFNETNIITNPIKRAMLFLYLNRHGFNGLCRYNKQGLYNVPFGCHRNSKNQPRSGYFPKKEMEMFLNMADRVTLIQGDFSKINQYIKSNSIVYFDPPYVDLIQENKEKIVSFNRYNANIFTLEDQKRLTDFAISLTQKHNALCCISNHDTIETRELYSIKYFDIYSLSVLRSIAANSEKRRTVEELLAFTK